MRKATKRTKQLLDVLHIGSSVGWLGVGIAQLTINVVALTTAHPEVQHTAHEIAHTLDRWPLTILSLTALATGVLLGLKTKWGLLRYWWVAAKLTLSCALLILVPIVVGGWVLEAIDLTASTPPGDSASASDGYAVVRAELLASSIVIFTTLAFMLTITVVKPWGRIRPAAARRRDRAELPGPQGR